MFGKIIRSFHKTVVMQRIETFVIPQPGEGIAEVEIVQWLVKPGQKVKEFQLLCEARSDKGFIEYKSPFEGVIQEILYAPSQLALIGTGLYKIDIQGEIGINDSKVNKNEMLAHKPEPAINKSSSNQILPSNEKEEAPGKYLLAPSARHLAMSQKIDLSKVQATGKGGRILKEDIINYLSSSLTKSVALEQPATNFIDRSPDILSDFSSTKLTPLQRGMLKSMTSSLTIPHLTYCEDVYMDRLISLRNQFKIFHKDLKLTYMPFFIKFLSIAMIDFPIANSILHESSFEYTIKGSHNICFAMDSPLGLIVPNVKNVQELSILEIAVEMARLQGLGTAGKLGEADLQGGTVSLSNIGSIGGTVVAPVIMPPQVFIGAFGSIRNRIEKSKGVFIEKSVIATSWSADHRLIDGATTARIVAKWKEIVEDPMLMIMHLK